MPYSFNVQPRAITSIWPRGGRSLAGSVALLALTLAVHVSVPTPAMAQEVLSVNDIPLRAGDVIRVAIWREQDLSGDFPIRSDGVVTLPLLGDRQVAGVPLGTLRSDLSDAYREYLRNPSITIVPLRRISVIGEVRSPGIYGIDATMSLAEVIAQAGGITPNGDVDRTRVLRDGEVLLSGINLQELVGVVDIRSGDQILVRERSWLARNGPAVLTSLATTALTSLLVTLLY